MLKINNEFKDLIPPLTADEYTALEESILIEGCRDAILVWNETIVDGHNRFEICSKYGIEFSTREINFESILDAKVWIRKNQLSRRNLSDAWKLELQFANKADLLEIGREKQATKVGGVLLSLNDKRTFVDGVLMSNMDRSMGLLLNNKATTDPHSTRKEIAKAVGVSTGKVGQAEVVRKHSSKLWDKAKAGDITIGAAYKEVKNILYKEEEALKKDTGNITISPSDLYKLYNNDLLLESRIQDNSLDAIITDPPYPYEFIDCWSKLAEFASNKLKEGGILVAMSGQSYLPEVYSRMNIPGLNYYWTCCIKTTVSPNMHQKRLLTHWKPLLFYVKGEYNKTFLKTDCYFPDYKDTVEGQTFHKWGQSLPLMEKIIEDFTYAGELVCDPFMGGGTTIVAGVNMKRNMIGIEIDEKVYNNTCKRIHYDVSGL